MILFKKQKLQDGGEITSLGQVAQDSKARRNPYVRKAVNPTQEKYLSGYLGTGETNTGYSYGSKRDDAFTKAYNTAGDEGVFAGDLTTPMFTMYPGKSYTKGPQVPGQSETHSYSLPRDAQGRVVTVGDYRSNPSAFQYATDQSMDLPQFNRYLGIK